MNMIYLRKRHLEQYVQYYGIIVPILRISLTYGHCQVNTVCEIDIGDDH